MYSNHNSLQPQSYLKLSVAASRSARAALAPCSAASAARRAASASRSASVRRAA